MTVSTGSTNMVMGAVQRAPMLAELAATSPAFAMCTNAVPVEMDTLAAVMLELDVDPALAESIVAGYMTRRLEHGYGIVTQHREVLDNQMRAWWEQ